MCAIVGWAGNLERGQWRMVHRFLNELLIASAVRGSDATGFAAIDRKHGFVSDKRAVRSPVFVASNAAWKRLSNPSCLIAHCRAATHGSPRDNQNNHPHLGHDLAVVVNGIAHNYREVAETFKLELGTECDSEVILRLLERQDHPAKGLGDAMNLLRGGMAAAVLDIHRETIWLARDDGRPAWLLKLASIHGYFFCSTHEIALRALQRTFGQSAQALVEMLIPLAARTVVGLSSDGRLIARHQPVTGEIPVKRI